MTAMSIFIPLPVPAHPDALSPSALSEKEQTSYDCILEHFSVAEYTLPDVNQEKGALTVDEKIWLVGATSLILCIWLTRAILSLQW